MRSCGEASGSPERKARELDAGIGDRDCREPQKRAGRSAPEGEPAGELLEPAHPRRLDEDVLARAAGNHAFPEALPHRPVVAREAEGHLAPGLRLRGGMVRVVHVEDDLAVPRHARGAPRREQELVTASSGAGS